MSFKGIKRKVKKLLTNKKQLSLIIFLFYIIAIFSIFQGNDDGSIRTIYSGNVGVRSVAWSPDGIKIASGSQQQTIEIWEGSTGKKITTLSRSSTYEAATVSWSPDSQKIVAGFDGNDQSRDIKIWDVNSGNEINSFPIGNNKLGHYKNIYSVDWSPDGTKIASADSEGIITIWDVLTGNPIQNFTGHTNTIWKIAWSPDGSKLASGSPREAIIIWDVLTGNIINTISPYLAGINGFSWSPDGNKLAYGSDDQAIKIRDLSTGTDVIVISKAFYNYQQPNSVEWSPDGSKIAAGYWNSIILWDAVTGSKIWTMEDDKFQHIETISWHPDSTKFVAAGGNENIIKIWKTDISPFKQFIITNREIIKQIGYFLVLLSTLLALSLIIQLFIDKKETNKIGKIFHSIQIMLFDPSKNKRINRSNIKGLSVLGFIITLNILMSLANTFTPMYTNIDYKGRCSNIEGGGGNIIGYGKAYLEYEGSYIGMRCSHPVISLVGMMVIIGWFALIFSLYQFLLEIEYEEKKYKRKGSTNGIAITSFIVFALLIVWGIVATIYDKQITFIYYILLGLNSIIVLWSLLFHWSYKHSMIPRSDSEHKPEKSGAILFFRYRKLIRSINRNKKYFAILIILMFLVSLLSLLIGYGSTTEDGDDSIETFRYSINPNNNYQSVSSLAWSPDGAKLASGEGNAMDGNIKILDAKTGREIRTLDGHTESVRSLAWSPDGSKLVSGSSDTTIKIWDVNLGLELHTLSGHSYTVHSMTWSPDGSKLASASADSSIKIWNALNGNEMRTINHSTYVRSVSWSPDGNKLASGFADNTIKIWNIGNISSSISEIRSLSHPGGMSGIWSLSWSPDGSKLASVSGSYSGGDGIIKVWDETYSEIDTFTFSGIVAITWTSNDKVKIAVASNKDNTVLIWDETGSEIGSLSANSKGNLIWHPDGSKLAGSSGTTINTYDTNNLSTTSENQSLDLKKIARMIGYILGIMATILTIIYTGALSSNLSINERNNILKSDTKSIEVPSEQTSNQISKVTSIVCGTCGVKVDHVGLFCGSCGGKL
ncbi:MAG: WD40 repeat domain-containing protein [Candidatus Kariarchaeaceae archaeon]|jgi:WD40 repeat protein